MDKKITVKFLESYRVYEKEEIVFKFNYDGELLTFLIKDISGVYDMITLRNTAEIKLKDHMIAVGYATEDSCIEVEYG